MAHRPKSSTTLGVQPLQVLAFIFWNGLIFLCFCLFAFWFRIRAGDIPAASNSVIIWNVSFFWCNYWGECDRKSPVSTPSKFNDSEIESLIRGPGKILSTDESALANVFKIFFFSRFNLLRESSLSLIFSKVLLGGRNENKLLHVKTNGWWR